MTQDGSEVLKGVLRLDGQAAIVVGGGQTPGQTIGNGRATAITYARAGARVLVADRDLDAAAATVAEITAEGCDAVPFRADVTDEADIAAMVADACDRWGRLDILHNIVNISSTAAHEDYPWVTYKASKAAAKAMTEQVAMQNAPHGIRVNCIQPGLMNTPMAVDARMDAWNMTREEVVAMRDAKVPLGGKMGTAWDVANAALFLVSVEARFITGVTLMVDGGAHCRIG